MSLCKTFGKSMYAICHICTRPCWWCCCKNCYHFPPKLPYFQNCFSRSSKSYSHIWCINITWMWKKQEKSFVFQIRTNIMKFLKLTSHMFFLGWAFHMICCFHQCYVKVLPQHCPSLSPPPTSNSMQSFNINEIGFLCFMCRATIVHLCQIIDHCNLVKKKKPKISTKQNMTFDVIKYIHPYTSPIIFVVFLRCNLKRKNPCNNFLL